MKWRHLLQIMGAALAVAVPAGLALPLWAACMVWGAFVVGLAGFLGDRKIPFQVWKVKLQDKWTRLKDRLGG